MLRNLKTNLFKFAQADIFCYNSGMQFIIENRINKLNINKAQALFLLVIVGDGVAIKYGEFYSLLSGVDRKIIDGVLKQNKFKEGIVKLVRSSDYQGFVFLVTVEKLDIEKLRLLTRQFARATKAENIKTIAFNVNDYELSKSAEEIATNILMAQFDFSRNFKKEPKEGWQYLEKVFIFSSKHNKEIQKEIIKGEILGEAINRARMLSSYPPSHMTPMALAEAAIDMGRENKNLLVEIFNEKKLKSLGMNAILAVGQGSANKPCLIIMEYKGGKAGERPLAFVGKGVTFDSGGLNLKPGDGMADMHMDMSGGASVLCAIKAIAQLKLPVNVVAIVPAVENMPSGLSYRQGDIIKAYGGKTIEIGNTDAEGRVILADAIEYSKTRNPKIIFTLATLTGAAMVALGTRMSALFVKGNHKLQDKIQKIGDECGDLLWPLPLSDLNEKDVEGNFADVTNTHKNNSRYGGASSAAAFLSHFAKPFPFAYIDMAPRMLVNPEEEFLSKGATGYGVRLFVEIVKMN